LIKLRVVIVVFIIRNVKFFVPQVKNCKDTVTVFITVRPLLTEEWVFLCAPFLLQLDHCRQKNGFFCMHQGVDSAYDMALSKFYDPYHLLIDLLVRVAVNQQCLTESIITLHATVAYEGVPLHMPYFAKLWYEIYMSENVDRHYVEMLCSTSAFIDYVDELLQEERASLNNMHIHQFLCNFFTRVTFSTFRGSLKHHVL